MIGVSLWNFYAERLNTSTGIPVSELDEAKLRQIRRETNSKPVIRGRSLKFVSPEQVRKRRERVQCWLDS